MIYIETEEWTDISPVEDERLGHVNWDGETDIQHLIRHLQGQVSIFERRDGISIETTSFVGTITLGDVRITIHPKIAFQQLMRLLKYAYSLRDIDIYETSQQSISQMPFQDLLVQQLLTEVKELLSRGLRRDYIPRHDMLSIPRGKIDMQLFVANGGLKAAELPCIHYPQQSDTIFNQLLLGGLRLATVITDNLMLRTQARRLVGLLTDEVSSVPLTESLILQGFNELNRLTHSYESALQLILWLKQGYGIVLDRGENRLTNLPGFLFDMNIFWERLLGKFLQENMPDYTVKDQFRLNEMMVYQAGHKPGRRSPSPRPDYAVIDNEGQTMLLDAKYRDIWNKGLPRDMLYQLVIYALSQKETCESAILYPTVSGHAYPETIRVQNPVNLNKDAEVHLRPINVDELDNLIMESGVFGKRRRIEYAHNLVFGTT